MDTATPNAIDVSIPENYNGNTVRIIVGKDNVKDEKESGFISFNMDFHTKYFMIGDKGIEMGDFYKMLREQGGLSDRLPLVVNIKPLSIIGFDKQPPCYGGKKVWYFTWKGIECSLTGNICIRVHNATLDAAEQTIKDILDEALKLWKDPMPTQSLAIYIPVRRVDGSYIWQEHSTRKKRMLETIYIDTHTKDRLTRNTKQFLNASDLYDKYGVTWKRINVFSGPPGTGKTSTVLSLASLFNKNIAKMTITTDMTAHHVELLFRAVPKESFLLLEDVDALFVGRSATTKVDFSTILNLMDGITTTRGLVLFMTTNHIEELDKAFIRPGRVDELVHFQLAGVEQWRSALKVLGDRWPHEHDAYIERLPSNTSIADIQKYLFQCIMEERESIL